MQSQVVALREGANKKNRCRKSINETFKIIFINNSTYFFSLLFCSFIYWAIVYYSFTDISISMSFKKESNLSVSISVRHGWANQYAIWLTDGRGTKSHQWSSTSQKSKRLNYTKNWKILSSCDGIVLIVWVIGIHLPKYFGTSASHWHIYWFWDRTYKSALISERIRTQPPAPPALQCNPVH